MILAFLEDVKQGPGSLQHRGRKCVRVFNGSYNRPNDGQFLVVHHGCWEGMQEFRLWPNGTLMLTKHNMCVRPNTTGPVTNGAQVSDLMAQSRGVAGTIINWCVYSIFIYSCSDQEFLFKSNANWISLKRNLSSKT